MKPTEASPETKEQFETHESPNLYQGVKTSLPPNSIISLGLALPHKFLKIELTTVRTLVFLLKNIRWIQALKTKVEI